MRRRLAVSSLLAIVCLAAASATSAEQIGVGNLRISFSGGIAPRALPRDRPAPVEVTIKGRIRTTDGSHPPALQRLEIGLNRAGAITTRGLPVCSAPLLQSTTTQAALAACGPALVGRGWFGASLGFAPGPVPSHGAVLAFNSRSGGRPALLLHYNFRRRHGSLGHKAPATRLAELEQRGG
jgi:hypothetical protein